MPADYRDDALQRLCDACACIEGGDRRLLKAGVPDAISMEMLERASANRTTIIRAIARLAQVYDSNPGPAVVADMVLASEGMTVAYLNEVALRISQVQR